MNLDFVGIYGSTVEFRDVCSTTYAWGIGCDKIFNNKDLQKNFLKLSGTIMFDKYLSVPSSGILVIIVGKSSCVNVGLRLISDNIPNGYNNSRQRCKHPFTSGRADYNDFQNK